MSAVNKLFRVQKSRVTSHGELISDCKIIKLTKYIELYIMTCYGFAWQGFRSGGARGVASVRSCEKLPACLIKTSVSWL